MGTHSALLYLQATTAGLFQHYFQIRRSGFGARRKKGGKIWGIVLRANEKKWGGGGFSKTAPKLQSFKH